MRPQQIRAHLGRQPFVPIRVFLTDGSWYDVRAPAPWRLVVGSRIEQLILVLYYQEGMTMKEIGRSLDLSESRVSQMHSAIITQLKRGAGDVQCAVPAVV